MRNFKNIYFRFLYFYLFQNLQQHYIDSSIYSFNQVKIFFRGKSQKVNKSMAALHHLIQLCMFVSDHLWPCHNVWAGNSQLLMLVIPGDLTNDETNNKQQHVLSPISNQHGIVSDCQALAIFIRYQIYFWLVPGWLFLGTSRRHIFCIDRDIENVVLQFE